MIGKASMLLIMGFSVMFMTIGYNFNSLTVRAVENQVDYYNTTNAHNIAVTGANMAANEIFLNKIWTAGYSNISFCGGVLNVTVDTAGTFKNITATGVFNGITRICKIKLRPSYFAKFGNFYSTLGASPATGDTFNGPFHVNATLGTYGTPVFNGKVSCKSGLTMSGTPKAPKFYGGYESGVDIPLEFDTSGMRNASATGGKFFRDTTGTGKVIDVKITFSGTNVITSFNIQDGKNIWSPPVTMPITTAAPNGMFYVEKGNIYTEGVVDGKCTIVASKKGSTNAGKVWVTNNLTYTDDPNVNPASNDMLGVIAEQTIRLQDNVNIRGHDITTQASMFSLTADIGPDDALITQAYLGSWNVTGGVIAKSIRATATYGTVGGISVPVKGYRFSHKYDERFMTTAPPYFPNTRHYEVVSWLE